MILFILFTAIGFTFKLKVLSLEEKKEFRGVFTVKWLLFSHTFLVGETETKVNLSEGSTEEKKERRVKDKQSETGIGGTQKSTEDIVKTQGKIEVERRKEVEEKNRKKKQSM
ncbi:MAG: hypothetical protein NHB15_21590 [Methanosarcina barkeri]|nr:hypothetical protein [Methanosarcina sp. ERenArc_MAG2]